MRSINLFSKSVLTSSLLIISYWASAHMPESTTHTAEHAATSMIEIQALSAHSPAVSAPMHDHAQEHGGQLYSRTVIDTSWLRDQDGQGTVQSKFETRIGTDENKIFIQAHFEKPESEGRQYDAKLLYSRMVSDFWDVQAGMGYRSEKVMRDHQSSDTEETLSAILGVHGLAPYFFETEAYLYAGEDDFWALSLETERDVLLTQKLILKPYLAMNVLLSDDSTYAQKTGLSDARLGLETRYEISKKIIPYVEIAYEYTQGHEDTPWQQASSADHGWLYGAGLRFIF